VNCALIRRGGAIVVSYPQLDRASTWCSVTLLMSAVKTAVVVAGCLIVITIKSTAIVIKVPFIFYNATIGVAGIIGIKFYFATQLIFLILCARVSISNYLRPLLGHIVLINDGKYCVLHRRHNSRNGRAIYIVCVVRLLVSPARPIGSSDISRLSSHRILYHVHLLCKRPSCCGDIYTYSFQGRSQITRPTSLGMSSNFIPIRFLFIA